MTPPDHPSNASFTHNATKTARARRLRTSMTDAERKLWSVLRGAQLGHSFRRQHPIGTYIADFLCADARLVIEVDGGQHGLSAKIAQDAERTEWLERQGIEVLRFWNNDVLQNLPGVWDVIATEIAKRVPSTPTLTLPLSGGGGDRPQAFQSGPSPRKGEDRRGLTPPDHPQGLTPDPAAGHRSTL